MHNSLLNVLNARVPYKINNRVLRIRPGLTMNANKPLMINRLPTVVGDEIVPMEIGINMYFSGLLLWEPMIQPNVITMLTYRRFLLLLDNLINGGTLWSPHYFELIPQPFLCKNLTAPLLLILSEKRMSCLRYSWIIRVIKLYRCVWLASKSLISLRWHLDLLR